MAKAVRKGPSASQAIRDYCRVNPDKAPKEVASEMVARGFTKVTAGYVSTIKSLAKKAAAEGASSAASSGKAETAASGASKGGAKRGRKPAGEATESRTGAKSAKGAASDSSKEYSIDLLVAVKKLADSIGGVSNALAALNALSKLGG